MPRYIDADALIADCQLAQKQADRHGREFANAFYSGGGEVSTEWWCVEDMIENAPTIEPRCETCEAFNKTRLLISQPQQRWIPCSKELPERNLVVLVTTRWGEVTEGVKLSGNAWFIGRGEENAFDSDIIAWMPKPEPYKEGGEDSNDDGALDEFDTEDILRKLPSAQPKKRTEERTETHTCDLISRQAAIETLNVGAELLGRVLDDADIVGAERAKYEWGLGLIESYISDMKEIQSAQPDSKELSSTHKALDTISRQAALNALSRGSGCGASCHRAIKALPSAQSELPEWAQKVEEYRKSAPSFVRNQLVWALYQTWKEYDGRLVHQRGKENR